MPLHESPSQMIDTQPRRTAASSLHVTSLLHFSTQLSEADSVEQLLNAAVLSIMGKLRMRRACVLQPDGDAFIATHTKGVQPFVVPAFEIDDTYFAMPDAAPSTRLPYPLREQGIDWLVPLVAQGELLCILCFGGAVNASYPDADTRVYVELVRAITTTAVHNARMVRTLIEAKKALEGQTLLVTTLYESARDFTGKLEPSEISRILAYRLMGQLMTSSFELVLDGLEAGSSIIAARRGTMHEVALTVPVQTRGTQTGVLRIGPKLNGQEFTAEEITFAEALGNTAMIAFETHRLVQVEVERGAFLKQLEIAAQIQQGLLPVQLPPTVGFDVAASTTPSAQIGGDYYDVVPIDADRTLVAIADVAGKGIPAALLMANVQAALNTLAPLDLGLDQIAHRVNQLVYDNTASDVFVTMFLCMLDRRTPDVQYVNAGHNPPVLVKDAKVELLSTGGVLSGVLSNPAPYQIGSAVVGKGDVLVLYTDGVTESRNAEGDEYGPDRLAVCISALRHLPSDELLAGIQQQLDEFSNADLPDDDTSIVVIKPI